MNRDETGRMRELRSVRVKELVYSIFCFPRWMPIRLLSKVVLVVLLRISLSIRSVEISDEEREDVKSLRDHT